jgi:hypothetical protein
MKSKYLLIISLLGFLLVFSTNVKAQVNLLDSLDNVQPIPKREFVKATFKGSRIINGHSVEQMSAKHMDFRISHRFGKVNSGAYNFFGLDIASIRLGLDYGLTNNLTVGLGRSSFQKTFDGYLKHKLIRQTTDDRTPVSVTAFTGVYYASARLGSLIEQYVTDQNKLSYVSQLLIARKFGERFSLQVSPTYVHQNMVLTKDDKNETYACGIAGRIKLTRRTSFNAEYFYRTPSSSSAGTINNLNIGFDIETGGHVFQLHISNSQSMVERGFIAQTADRWSKGGIFYGFNISRTFSFDR